MQVLGAPLAENETEKDTSEHRLYALRKLDKTFEEAKEAFTRWKVAGKRLKEVFTKATSDKTVIKDETAEEPTEEDRDNNQERQTRYQPKMLKVRNLTC